MPETYPNWPVGNKYGNADSSQKLSSKIKTGVFPSPGAIMIFSSSAIKWGISDIRAVSTAADLYSFWGSSQSNC